jgi:hypothetical protein
MIMQLLLPVLKSTSRTVVSEPRFETKGWSMAQNLHFSGSQQGKIKKPSTATCLSVKPNAHHMLATCWCYENVQKRLRQPPNHFLSSAWTFSCSDAVQSTFSCGNQVLSTMDHKAVMGYTFVHSSSFSKQLLATSIWPRVASNGSVEKNLVKKHARRPPADDHHLLTSSDSAEEAST